MNLVLGCGEDEMFAWLRGVRRAAEHAAQRERAA